MEQPLELYHYQTVKKIKRIFVSLGDYFLLMIVSFSLFTLVGKPIYNSLPVTNEIQSRYQSKETELIEIIENTTLQSYDKIKNRLISLNEKSKEYIDMLVRTSFYSSNRDYEVIESGKKTVRKIEKEETFFQDEKKDSLSYYYLTFRKEQSSSYRGSLSMYDKSSFQKDLLLLDSTNQDLVDDSFALGSDFLLSDSVSDKILYYLNYGEGEGKTLYDRISNLFVSLSQKGIKEIESDYLPYVSAMNDMKESFHQYVIGYDVTMIIAYTISFIIYFVLLAFIFKKGRTAVFRFTRLCSIQNDGFPLEAKSFVLRSLVLFISFFHVCFFSALFSNQLNILSYSFLGPISMFQMIVFSFLLSILSLIFVFISKDNQTLSDFASSSYVVDLNHTEGENDHGKQ